MKRYAVAYMYINFPKFDGLKYGNGKWVFYNQGIAVLEYSTLSDPVNYISDRHLGLTIIAAENETEAIEMLTKDFSHKIISITAKEI